MVDAKKDVGSLLPGDFFHANGDYSSDRIKLLFEQYKLYVDTTENVSDRRGTANTFLLSANTALVTVYGLAAGKDVQLSAAAEAWRWLIPMAGLLLCASWISLLAGYRALNSAKFRVVQQIEHQLPVELFALESGYYKTAKRRLFAPLSSIEQIVPTAFGLVYLVMMAQAFGLV